MLEPVKKNSSRFPSTASQVDNPSAGVPERSRLFNNGGGDNPEAVSTLMKPIRSVNESDYEPMIAVSPANSNNLSAVYMGRVVGVARPRSSVTQNGGVTWITSDVPVAWFIYSHRADPVVAYDRVGNAYYCYLDFNPPDSLGPKQNAIVVMKSIDGGASWTERHNAINYEASRPGVLSDKPWIACDQSTPPYQNNVYVTWTRFSTASDAAEIMFSRKRATEQNFSTPSVISTTVTGNEYVNGSQVVIAPDGTIYIFWLKMAFITHPNNVDEETEGSLWMAKSTNGGDIFQPPTQITALGTVRSIRHKVLGGRFQRATSLPAVSIRPLGSSYEIYIVWGDHRNNRPEVLLSRSGDFGSSWSTINRLDPQAYEQFLPAITCNRQGRVFISCFDKISSTSNNIRLMVSESTDGVNFTSSTDGSNYPGIMVLSPGDTLFTGDYMGIAANDHSFWAIWPGAVGSGGTAHNDIFGSYKGVTATIRNDPSIPATTYVQYNGQQRQSPYPSNYEVAGSNQTIRASDPVLIGNDRYTFQEWRDENNALISNFQQTVIQIESHTYTAKFSVAVSATIKNEFKEPNGTISYGGIVNVNSQDINTDLLPNQQYATTFPKNGPSPRLEAKEQLRAPFGTVYWRGFNPIANQNGGWEYPDQITREYVSVIFPPTPIQGGQYLAHYRNRYNVTFQQGTFFEPGGTSTGSYYVNGTDRGSTWTEGVWQYNTVEVDVHAPPGWEFGYWNDGNTSNPRIFSPTDNMSVHAVYKKHLGSTTHQATSSSSQRKLARLKTQGSWGVHEAYYLVYESSGEIWLTETNDYGATWIPEVRVSDGTGNFSAPSVAAVVRNGGSAATGGGEGDAPADLQVYVVYRKQVGSQYQIVSRIRVPGTGNTPLWLAPQVISQSGFTPTTIDVRPIIAYHTTYGYEQLLSAWEATDGIRQRTASNSNNTWYWGTTDGYFMLANVPGCKSPSVSNKHGNGLHQLWGALVFEGDVWAGPEGSALWPVTDKGEYVNSRNPTVAFDAVGRVHLSWVAYDNSRGMDVVVHRSSDDPYTPNWSPFYVIVDDFGDPSQLTTSVLAHDDEADGGVSVEWADGLNFVFANHAPDGVNFKDWRWASFGGYVVAPNASHISRPDYDFAVLTLNSQPLSTITNVTFGMPYAPSGSPASPTSSRSKSKLYRSILLQDTTVRSQVRFQLGDIVLVRGNDTINSQLRFEKTRNREGQSFIRSECFRVNQQNVKARFAWEAVGNNLRHPLTVAINLVDSATGNVIARLNDYSISENRRIDVRRKLNENLPLRAAPMYITMSIQGLPESMYRTSLANIEEIQFSDSTASKLAKLNGGGTSNSTQPTAFALHNAHPNPFNTSAQINFDLPEPSRVSLVVHDVLGRKVVELANSAYEAGYHSVNWNATNVASGVYFARFTATDASGNLKLSKVNKLLLAK
jgi:hypothetical protein